VAVIVAVVARTFLAPIPGSAATIAGIGVGGYIAGKWADSGGLYHGAVVGAGWIALEALGAVPTAVYGSDVLTDTVIVIALDLVTLLAGSIGGWLARSDPLSSSGTGTGR
jgi:hypothetical protein